MSTSAEVILLAESSFISAKLITSNQFIIMESKKERLDRIIKELVAKRVGVHEAFVYFCEGREINLATTLIGTMDAESAMKMAAKSILLARGDSQEWDEVIKVERETNDGYDILIPLSSYHCLLVKAMKSENDLPGYLRMEIKRTVDQLKIVLNSEDLPELRNGENHNPTSTELTKNEKDDRWNKI